jgi:uncharacterized protein YndB with AHSA1/START domain
MSEFSYTTEFAAPREAVWPYLEDPEKIKQWMIGVVEDRPTSAGPTRVGSTFEMDIKEGRKITTYQGEVTKYDRPRLMGVKMVGSCGKQPMTMFADYELSDLGGGRTRMLYTGRCTPPSGLLFKLMMPLFKVMGRMMIKKFMRNLRGLVESPAQQAAGR